MIAFRYVGGPETNELKATLGNGAAPANESYRVIYDLTRPARPPR